MIAFLKSLSDYVVQALTMLGDFVLFIINIPDNFKSIFVTFPLYIQSGLYILFSFVVAIIVIKLWHYLRG